MDYPFKVPGYDHISLKVRTGWLSAPTILYRGARLKKVGSRAFRLYFSDRTELTLQLESGGLFAPPKVIYNYNIDAIRLARPQPIYAPLFIYLPLVLVLFSGLMGWIYVAAATATNLMIFDSTRTIAIKISLSLLVTAGAVLAWFFTPDVFGLLLRDIHMGDADWTVTGQT